MRKPQQQEIEQWLATASEHGFVNEEGGFRLGRYKTKRQDDGALELTFITPLPAGLYTESDLRAKKPPILFERTAAGEIVLPGRWWASMFEGMYHSSQMPPELRESALLASRTVQFNDCILPSDTDTIEILAPESTGEMVPTEALIPGTKAHLDFTVK